MRRRHCERATRSRSGCRVVRRRNVYTVALAGAGGAGRADRGSRAAAELFRPEMPPSGWSSATPVEEEAGRVRDVSGVMEEHRRGHRVGGNGKDRIR